MTPSWQVLIEAGVPAGATRRRPAPPLRWERVRDALAEVLAAPETLDAPAHEALVAWLNALRDHWPSRFRSLVDDEPVARLENLTARDQDRFLKLRRIAIDHLSRVA